MESVSFRQIEIVEDLLRQIRKAILDLQEWNKDVHDVDDWLTSSEGMKTLAASSMLIEAKLRPPSGKNMKKVLDVL